MFASNYLLPKLVLLAVYLPLRHAFPLNAVSGSAESSESNDSDLWFNLSAAVALVLIGGVFAGLTIALMGQDAVHLQVLATSGEGRERKHAQTVLNLVNKGKHWVLVTLLLGNVVVNESLPIVLDKTLGGGWPAVLGSTVLIVIFGEVIPQSVCVRYGLPIGAYLSPVVLVLMYLFAPAAWPTAKLLDYLLGENHGTVYKKAGLKTLVTLHKSLGSQPAERLNEDEVTIITAVLDLKAKPVKSIMTPMEHVFTVASDAVLDEETMERILSAGFSRIPVHVPENQGDFIGMLLVKTLITYDPEDAKKVDEFVLATLPETGPGTSCLDILNYFQEGHSHMALVSESPGENGGALGVVTLEDVVEELIGEEIIDESDRHGDPSKPTIPSVPVPTPHVQRQPSFPTPDTRTLRRSSTNPIAKTGLINSITPEQRQHLDNLAPSNLARSPKHTRFPFVKIKRASAANGTGSRKDAPADERTPLLDS
ncbi:uncharacterized protein DSM5745_01821 [Aspergillus mulundensis]|uniref:DUF21-domain-containing protein n=1 Tax=Aspergillus mulundensis TaxID=1810919 RepID=A0A3D8SUS9_9EURO|nr:Uncharacterized protein DSM5745_01821 [Aspergillus mulundensis]RDW90046.1 Uncharacterized protein DSM5745_01821 [Aspergillus mulundensis]